MLEDHCLFMGGATIGCVCLVSSWDGIPFNGILLKNAQEVFT